MVRVFALVTFIFFGLFLSAIVNSREETPDLNSLILEEVSTMPIGGNYSTKAPAFHTLASSIQSSPTGELIINPLVAMPSFCSAATYMIFLKILARLQKNSLISLSPQTCNALLVRSQPDGTGIWGRWNANGPGTACLFHELSLGNNFTDFAKAKPGDFAKFFWTSEVGAQEHGHSVIYLGNIKDNGKEMIRFWSSNIPGGYGEKSVPRTRIKLAIFSRLRNPQNIQNHLPDKNDYLASLLKKRSSFQEALQQCGAAN